MGERNYISISKLSEVEDVSLWRIRQMIRLKELKVRHINGKPIKPYVVDHNEFKKLDSSTCIKKDENPGSLKFEEEIKKALGHRKEPLWQK